MDYSFNPELAAILKKEWAKIGLAEDIQECLLKLMDISAFAIIEKESRRIARHLVDEGLSPERVKRITDCAIEDGSKTLNYLKSYTYDWVLLDLVLPEVEGIDVIKDYRCW